jgi:phosphoribosyl-AMP cyclohydrolase
MSGKTILETAKFDDKGLITGIVQDADTGEVLMLAHLNREALEKTIETGKIHFYSRSRNKLWVKGEESGHTQELVEIRVDCDQDAVLLKARQKVAACHDGYRSCFYRRVEPKTGELTVVEKRVFDPGSAYKSGK